MATKTFPYSVIWNGEIIPANTPIEVKEEKTVKTEAAKKPTKKAVKSDDNT